MYIYTHIYVDMYVCMTYDSKDNDSCIVDNDIWYMIKDMINAGWDWIYSYPKDCLRKPPRLLGCLSVGLHSAP